MQKLSDAGNRVFAARLAARNEHGEPIETFEQAVSRISHAAARAEKDSQKQWEERFASSIGDLLFIPSTPILANVGKSDRAWQPAACFVLSVEDSLKSMYQTLMDTALIFKSGGGVGYNLSAIRPSGALVRSTKGQASGVVELVKLFDASSNMVMQGGVRRGASMGILNCDHPEILSFVGAKRNGGIANFNLSVGITDAFMDAVEKGGPWALRFQNHAASANGHIEARELWDAIVHTAHACGDPGLVFLDALQRGNPFARRLDATNPCGELPLFPNESCLLGAVNLSRMVIPDGHINHALLAETVAIGIRFLDNLIDIADYPLPQIGAATTATRKVGLGFTGLADLLIKLRLPYDSEAGRDMAADIAKRIQDTAHAVSHELGMEKGVFPDWENSSYAPHLPRRNAACTVVAPTGSVTVLAGCEGYGVEPIFAVSYSKATNVAGHLAALSPLFLDACQARGVPHLSRELAAKAGTCQGIDGIPDDIAALFKGAAEISWRDHLLMQAAVQAYVDSAVSKTINLPASASINDISECYRLAHRLGLKGVTVFRDGCKEGTVTVGERAKQSQPAFVRGEVRPRPNSAHGITHRLDTGCGKLYLTVNHDNGSILETFITTGSDGGCLVYTEAASRLISLALRGGIPAQEIAEQMQSTHSCPSYMFARGKGKNLSPGKSCASAIAHQIILTMQEISRKQEKDAADARNGGPLCECGSLLVLAEGCMVCSACGYAKC